MKGESIHFTSEHPQEYILYYITKLYKELIKYVSNLKCAADKTETFLRRETDKHGQTVHKHGQTVHKHGQTVHKTAVDADRQTDKQKNRDRDRQENSDLENSK